MSQPGFVGGTHVVRLITRLNIGGPARQALSLTRELRSTHPTLLAAGVPPDEEGELVDPEVTVRRVPFVRPVRPLTDARALVAVRRLLETERPAIVHTHMAKAGAVGRVASSTLRHPPRTVHTFHGHVLEGYFSPATQRGFLEVERRLARRTDALVAISTEIRDELLDLGIGRPSQYRVIPLGFDLSPFLDTDLPSGRLRSRLGLAPDDPLIGIVGRLAPIKDHTTLLEAMVHLPRVHLAVLGDGELRGRLEAHARRSGIADRVHFTGWWHDIADATADLDVAVLTSRNEGTPVALIEALAAGKPAVATDVGGVRAVVDDGVSGYLVPPGDPRGLAARIRRLLDHPRERQAFGAAGRQHVADRFTLERLVGDVRSLYDELAP